MEKLDPFEISRAKYLRVVFNNYKYFKIIWSLRKTENGLKVTKYIYRDESYST